MIFLKKSKRVAIVAALFIFFKEIGWAQKTETYKDIIEKAYNISLQRDRIQATSLLISALKRETKKEGRKELQTALEKVSTVFYSDKAQQIFETGNSLFWTDPSQAQAKLIDANQLESGNLVVEMTLIRSLLAVNKCSVASRNLEKNQEIIDFFEDLQLLQAQIMICNSKFEEYKIEKQKQNQKRQDEIGLWWSLLDVEYFFRSSLFSSAMDALRDLEKKWASYPEIYFWKHKIEVENKVNSEETAQKYTSLCKAISPRQQRSFSRDPWLCRRITEVENYLKKINN